MFFHFTDQATHHINAGLLHVHNGNELMWASIQFTWLF